MNLLLPDPLRAVRAAAAIAIPAVGADVRASGKRSPMRRVSRHRGATLAAGVALTGSAVDLAFFLSRKPTGATGGGHATFRA
jgi:hypothetical protein